MVGTVLQMLGLAQGALDTTLPYLKERKAFGRPIWENQVGKMKYKPMAVLFCVFVRDSDLGAICLPHALLVYIMLITDFGKMV